MASGAARRKLNRRPSGEDPGSPFHYGRASEALANPKGYVGRRCNSVLSHQPKGKKKDRPGGAGRPIKKGVVKNLMDNFNTGTPKKSSILEQMEIMAGVVESLGNAGVDIIHAQVGKPEDTYILFYYCDGAFRKWAEDNELSVVVEPIESEYHKWRIGTTVNGIDVHSYMSNRDKEEYDGATV